MYDALVDAESLVAVRVQARAPSGGGYGFLVGRDPENQHHIIKHIEKGSGLRKGDR